MPEAKTLNNTESIKKRLEVEYQIFNQFLFEKLSNCLGYKTDFLRPEGRRPSICPQWEHFHSVIESRESLSYRVSSLLWHCMQFPDHHKVHVEKISKLWIEDKEHHNETRHAVNMASFLFDDVVFCAVSVFDYLAQLIFRLNFPSKTGQKFWSNLEKERNHEDKSLGELIKQIHYEFVKGLSKLRGRSIHTMADSGGIELKEYFHTDGVTHSFNFTIPKQARKQIPIFAEVGDDFPIEPGSYLIAVHTIFYVNKILDKLGSYEYKCQYDPHKK
jgi:hypothetical protein